MRTFLTLAADRGGAAAIQYAVVAGLIAIAVAGTLTFAGPTIQHEYQKIADALRDTQENLGLAPSAEEAVITGTVTKP